MAKTVRRSFGGAGDLCITDSFGQRGERAVRGVGVSLDLDHRDRRIDAQVILRAVLPSLVVQPVWILPLVLDESIAVDVAVRPNPVMRRDKRRPEVGDE